MAALADSGKFGDAAIAMEAIVAMMPPMADDDLAHVLRNTFRCTLASGVTRRAATIHQLMMKVASARLPSPEGLSDRIPQYQLFLDQLAKDQAERAPPLHDRLAVNESPGQGERQLSAHNAEIFVETKIVLPELISRRAAADTGEGWIPATEIAELLALHDEVGHSDVAAAKKCFVLAQKLRKQACQNEAERAARQKWFEGKITRLAKNLYEATP